MEIFTKYGNKKVTAINNELFIILNGLKPRPLFTDDIGPYYLKRNNKTTKKEKVYVGY